MKKITLLMLLSLTSCSSVNPSATTMITNIKGNSGGTGTVISSFNDHSDILTNGHVCGVVEHGGFVITEDGSKHLVESYKKSERHDLCLITVAEDLKVNTSTASSPPKRYETITVIGHPHLLPTIISNGYISSKLKVNIMMGTRDCTELEKLDENTSPFCLIIGKLPIVKTFEAIVTSALTQPGSSGSAIYNNGKIVAVVFAGEGDMSYSIAVPYEYVVQFLTEESPTMLKQVPNFNFDFSSNSENKRNFTAIDFLNTCKEKKISNTMCKLLEDSTKYKDLLVR